MINSNTSAKHVIYNCIRQIMTRWF